MKTLVLESLREIRLNCQQISPTSVIILLGYDVDGSVVTMGVLWIALGLDISSRFTDKPCSGNKS
jgi:hypothetical protein